MSREERVAEGFRDLFAVGSLFAVFLNGGTEAVEHALGDAAQDDDAGVEFFVGPEVGEDACVDVDQDVDRLMGAAEPVWELALALARWL